MATLNPGDICVIEARLNGAWTSKYYLASILQCEEDTNDNWLINRVCIVGDTEERDVEADKAIIGYSRIWQEDKQRQARKVAETIKPLYAFNSLDEVRNAITGSW